MCFVRLSHRDLDAEAMVRPTCEIYMNTCNTTTTLFCLSQSRRVRGNVPLNPKPKRKKKEKADKEFEFSPVPEPVPERMILDVPRDSVPEAASPAVAAASSASALFSQTLASEVPIS